MKLTKEEIKLIDSFLVGQNIKYLDVRSELIDHLATDFEENSNYVLLEDFLISKVSFIKDFAKKQQKNIHWSYQKQLWIQLAKFFYKPKFLLLLFGLAGLSYIVLQFFTLEKFSLICYFVLMTLVLYPLFYQIKYSKAIKKVQSLQSLFTVTALPMIFLYSFLPIKDILFENPVVLMFYCSFSILLGLSALIIIENNRKKILKKYYQLVNNK